MIKKAVFYIFTILLMFIVPVGFAELYFRILYDNKPALEIYNSNQKSIFSEFNDYKCSWPKSLYPSSYFGHTHSKFNRCSQDNLNSIGMVGREFPVKRNEEYFDILIIGGSVAYNLINRNHLTGEPGFLRKKLEESYLDSNGRTIRVFSGAVGAWKQPSQLFFYQAFGENFDAVLSVEGANEFTIDISSSLIKPMSFASFFYDLPDVDFHFQKYLLSIFEISDLFVVNKLREALVSLLKESYEEKLKESEFTKAYQNKSKSLELDIETREKEYINFLRILNLVTKSRKQKHAIFFQPIVDLKKIIHEDERMHLTHSVNYTKFYKNSVKKLIEVNKDLNLFSLLDLFNKEARHLYSDYVHFKYDENGHNLGHELITKAIINNLKLKWRIKKKDEKNN